MKKSFLLALLSIMSTLTIAQNGWIRPQKDSWTQISYQQWSSKEFYNAEGNLTNTANAFSSSEVTLYSEFGISPRANILVNAPLFKSAKFDNTESASGFGDVRLEFKYKPFAGNFPFALQAAVEVPTGKAENLANNLDPALGFVNLPTGDGEWNFWATAVASQGFTNWMYGTLHAGYNFRTAYAGNNFSNQYRIGSEIGVSPYKTAWIIAKYSGLFAQKLEGQSNDFLRQSGTNFSQYGIMFLTEITHGLGISVQYNGFSNFPSKLTNLYTPNYLSFGIFWNRQKA